MASDEEHVEIVRRFCDAWSDLDLDALMAFFTDDAVYHNIPIAPVAGRAAIRLSATYTIHQSAEVVETAYHMAGATAGFKSNPFERRFRDMHTIAQQIQARDNHFEDVGKMILTNSVIPRGPTM